MTSAPTDQRRSFDTAIERFKAGDAHGALTGFGAITAAQPTMSDAWLGRVDETLASCAWDETWARMMNLIDLTLKKLYSED